MLLQTRTYILIISVTIITKRAILACVQRNILRPLYHLTYSFYARVRDIRRHYHITWLLSRYDARSGSCRFHQRVLSRDRGSAIISVPRAPSHRHVSYYRGRVDEDGRTRAAMWGRRYEIAPVAVARKQGARAKVTLAPSARYRANEPRRAAHGASRRFCERARRTVHALTYADIRLYRCHKEMLISPKNFGHGYITDTSRNRYAPSASLSFMTNVKIF